MGDAEFKSVFTHTKIPIIKKEKLSLLEQGTNILDCGEYTWKTIIYNWTGI